MSSMFFRKPGEDTSTSSDDSNDPSEDMNVSDANASQSDLDNILSRINTINSSTASLQIGSGRQTPLSGRPNISRSNSHVRDLVLHSLLEDKALRDAAEHLGKDVSDPEVQKLGSETYHALSRQMANSRIVDEMYASPDMRDHRARAQEGITAATRSHLAGLPASAITGDSLALMRQNIAVPLSGVLDGISSPIRLLFQSYPGLRNDHYTRDFVELELVGKGGYGKVYKVQHKLDNALYAVKRITVSPARLRRMHENGPHEMEKVLEEVRALAKFDHENIVRYHSAWLEFTTGPAVPAPVTRPTSSIFQGGRLIQDASLSTASFGTVGEFNVHLNDWSIGDCFGNRDQEYNGVFFGEDSDAGTGTEVSQGEVEKDSLNVPGRTSNPSKRRASQASHMTDATASSARTRKSTAESDHSEEDEDVETIPRSHHPHSQELTSDMTGSMMSDSDVPSQLISPRISGPVLVLNVQMSLYDTSLAAYIAPDQPTFSANPELHHCFHPCIALEILSQILSGVEYLHGNGVVHRDLKPANIFLSLSTARKPPAGSVNLHTCHECPAQTDLKSQDPSYATPRIGDFGLVAALGPPTTEAEVVTPSKPVGTEFYRPPNGGSVSEKLDVFALGIMAFEMLCKFDTKSERAMTLMQVRRGELPGRFAESLGECGEGVKALLAGMLHADEHERSCCDQVRREVEALVKSLKRQT